MLRADFQTLIYLFVNIFPGTYLGIQETLLSYLVSMLPKLSRVLILENVALCSKV